jgi:hypothetical protein
MSEVSLYFIGGSHQYEDYNFVKNQHIWTILLVYDDIATIGAAAAAAAAVTAPTTVGAGADVSDTKQATKYITSIEGAKAAGVMINSDGKQWGVRRAPSPVVSNLGATDEDKEATIKKAEEDTKRKFLSFQINTFPSPND